MLLSCKKISNGAIFYGLYYFMIFFFQKCILRAHYQVESVLCKINKQSVSKKKKKQNTCSKGRFTHPSFGYVLLCNPTNKTETYWDKQTSGGLLIANHMDQSL
jgi:hypothetical protein